MVILKTMEWNKKNKNNSPKQITELTTSNNTTACNATQIIITQTEHILNSFNSKEDENREKDILKYIDEKQSDKLTNEQLGTIGKSRTNSKLVKFLTQEQNTNHFVNGPLRKTKSKLQLETRKWKSSRARYDPRRSI